ncbi:MAG: DNA polymerase IV [Methanomicrobiaceae archaeon]|nr:DNA polymerase IV [Methanomicrobiaceae archaeon]
MPEKAPSKRIIMHIDMDSFFASVEVRENPSLKGKPVVVGADPKEGSGRGVVSTCSYEAREYGIRSAMPVNVAYNHCPDCIFLPVNMPLYRETSASIMEIIKNYSDKFQQVSIDEAYIDVSYTGSFDKAAGIATEIKDRILSSEGITCSVGIGPGKVIAKMASGMNKPAGMTVVRPGEVRDFLNHLPVEAIPGIGRKTKHRLEKHGINTIKDLSECDIQELKSAFGKQGIMMHMLAHGIDDSEVIDKKGQKSIGKQKTYPQDVSDESILNSDLVELCMNVHSRLKMKGYSCRTITVKIRYAGFIDRSKAESLLHPTGDLEAIYKKALEVFIALYDGRPVRSFGISLSGFDHDKSMQTRLDDF